LTIIVIAIMITLIVMIIMITAGLTLNWFDQQSPKLKGEFR